MGTKKDLLHNLHVSRMELLYWLWDIPNDKENRTKGIKIKRLIHKIDILKYDLNKQKNGNCELKIKTKTKCAKW